MTVVAFGKGRGKLVNAKALVCVSYAFLNIVPLEWEEREYNT